MPSEIQVGVGWFEELKDDFSSDWFKGIRNVVAESFAKGKIRPEPKNIFRALREVQPDDVKVVIIGQDPYPAGNHADGLSFSSQQKSIPKSLEIIYDDLERAYGSRPSTGDLTFWARQGVLLLNTSLSVINGQPMSHAHIGWDKLIRRVFEVLARRKGIVYVAWGTPARNLVNSMVSNRSENRVIESTHPIAESYSGGRMKFNGRFKEIDDYLITQGKEPIQWIPQHS